MKRRAQASTASPSQRVVAARRRERRLQPMTAPLYQVKAEFFKTLGHPARIRVLELLSSSEMSVGQLQQEIGLESSHLSQQLAVLRRAGLVATRKQGTTVFYSLSSPEIAEFLAIARGIITGVLTGQLGVLEEMQLPAIAGPQR
jgi:DNA-binding transcriptional ArsR family regulator